MWASEVRKNALAKSAKEEERARERTAAFVETEKAQATVEKLSARMQLLGLDHNKEAPAGGGESTSVHMDE